MSRVNSPDPGNANHGFALAAKNQHAIDRLYYKLLNLPADEFLVFPRPSKWANRHPLITRIFKYAATSIAFLWSYVFAYVYIIARVATYAIGKRKTRDPSRKIKDVMALAVCDRSCSVISQVASESGGIVWITPPGVRLSQLTLKKIGANVADAASLLSLRNKFLAAKQALAAHRYLVAEYGISVGLQSYAVTDWMLTLFATTVVSPKKIITAEHHDRWAVMADFYCSSSTENGRDCQLELAQHGKEYENTYQEIEKITKERKIPYTLKSVKKLYVYSPEQLAIFTKNILSESSSEENGLLVEYFSPNISLTECSGTELKVLIIGHPICELFQIQIYKSFFSNTEIACFYKPHPAAAASTDARSAGWRFISDKEFFPHVDLIISYPSTLVDEYETMGIPSLVHSLDASEDCLADFTKAIKARLGNLARENAGANEDTR